jgi:hypothetical protein
VEVKNLLGWATKYNLTSGSSKIGKLQYMKSREQKIHIRIAGVK